jgi:hypothetical protein
MKLYEGFAENSECKTVPPMNLCQTAEHAIAAYGGRSLWESASSIEADVCATGLAFILKWRPFFHHSRIVMEVHNPVSRLSPIGNTTGLAGVLDHADVRLEDERGRIVSERRNARECFTPGRRLFWWDDLDMAYFANYASWNYFTLPALLMREDIAWSELKPGLMQARFPETIPTHNRLQQFRFSPESGRLIQHDYTAEIISPLATAANVVLEHATNSDGLVYPSERRVTPRSPDGTPLPFPVLIHLKVHDFRLKRA